MENDAVRNWRRRWRNEEVRKARIGRDCIGVGKIDRASEEEYAYCRLKTPCPEGYKELKRAKRSLGLLYVLCLKKGNGCNQMTFYPQKIDLKKANLDVSRRPQED